MFVLIKQLSSEKSEISQLDPDRSKATRHTKKKAWEKDKTQIILSVHEMNDLLISKVFSIVN